MKLTNTLVAIAFGWAVVSCTTTSQETHRVPDNQTPQIKNPNSPSMRVPSTLEQLRNPERLKKYENYAKILGDIFGLDSYVTGHLGVPNHISFALPNTDCLTNHQLADYVLRYGRKIAEVRDTILPKGSLPIQLGLNADVRLSEDHVDSENTERLGERAIIHLAIDPSYIDEQPEALDRLGDYKDTFQRISGEILNEVNRDFLCSPSASFKK